ncbi:radical SAM family heme chaperone HemW [Staphylococcus carnosus]|uniref:Heme chaperone HemW n=4 Tax=Staphylococcus carnosus TaxID=1281 RepID=B9DNK3_STACT|nr:radical SAM family heme chaperone HemW [Staphylococcus carnosus]KKB26144.1 coproporphyrinogen III oxidase [Staphylococcus carnosus]KOR13527.1 coproporphyrinogen III oxidase [Staphylococcus carnosus]QPT04236.1 oxygen-independent coproporphyrinogen III oxidase [Staphylococcus carnosus]QQS85111.1 oxygen-independent coproporphyrinogen III oxidase [Staphylococcus carnosus]QRQ05051.1 oxygen-independent coproporphyrinogen III oxidase [Staphylococcus carnosus]
METKSAYIHIPFCVRICTYCDFNKYFIQNQPVDEYLNCLIKELSQPNKKELNTMFVGGGTPTALSTQQLEKLLKAINDNYIIKNEYTFEANPDELTNEKVQLLKDYGVNRLSMGVQTFDQSLLKILGRTHNTNDIYQAVNLANKFDINSISLDLMYHLPGQTIHQFEESLDIALSMDINHISSYGLILEPKTQFYNMYRKGKLKLPNEDLGEEMYDLLLDKIQNSNMHQYEISNFSQVNHESEHNKVYWKNEYYYGFGAGASGYVDGVRYSNVNPVNHYIKKIKNGEKPILQSTIPNFKEQIEEQMFLGLRMNKGVSKKTFENRFDKRLDDIYSNELNDLISKGLIEDKGEYVKLTERGKVIGNEVFEAFLID